MELMTVVTGTPFPYEVIWNGGPELGTPVLNYIAQENTTIKVAVIDSVGCVGTSTLELQVPPTSVYVPTAFSPNADNINDVLDIYTSRNVAEVRLQVFSRTGNLVFDDLLSPIAPTQQGLVWRGWDGTFNGKRLQPQVLVTQVWYRAIRGEWETVAGDVVLVR